MLKNYEFWSLGFALVSALIGFGLFCLKTFLPQKNNQINLSLQDSHKNPDILIQPEEGNTHS